MSNSKLVEVSAGVALVWALSLTACADNLGQAPHRSVAQNSAESVAINDGDLKADYISSNIYEISLVNEAVRAMTIYIDGAVTPHSVVITAPFSSRIDTSKLAQGSHTARVELEIELLGHTSTLIRLVTFNVISTSQPQPQPQPQPMPQPTPTITNLVNESFESGMGAWVDWGGASVQATDARTGQRSLRVGPSPGGAGLDIFSSVAPGKSYHIRAFARNPQPSVYVGIGIKIETAGRVVLLETPVAVRSTTYQQVDIDFTMPAGAAMANVYIWKEVGTDYAYLDDITVTESGSNTGGGGAPTPPTTGVARDVLKQPFSETSIWNMPIGRSATYVSANIPILNGYKVSKLDEEKIVLRPSAPLVNVFYNGVGWSGGNRCVAESSTPLLQVPMPAEFVVPNSGENESATFLLADRRSIVQMQPLARCTAGGIATTYVKWNSIDLYGDGIPGAHGGSNLSAFGGSLRVGELRPGQQGPRHAIKVIVQAANTLYRCTTAANCFRWPASTADNYAVNYYGKDNPAQSFSMRMGALLALNQSLSIASLALETEPARQLAFTLQNYGAYIVDDSYGDGFGFAAESGPDGRFRDQFRSDFGFDFTVNAGAGTPWSRDLEKLIRNLSVVDNNSAASVGGGGVPLQPLLPKLN